MATLELGVTRRRLTALVLLLTYLPACLLTLAGRWNWWPGRRVVPDEGVAA